MSVTHDITAVIREHHPRVQRVLRRFGVHERDLPDATQDVFIVVCRRIDTFEGRSKLSTWIHRIAFHVASEHRRRACNRREVLVEAESTSAASFDEDARERLALITRALDGLDPDKREVWIDFELEEQPMALIASRLGIPLKTAFSRLYAARRELMRYIRDSGLAAALPWPWHWHRRGAQSFTWVTTMAAVVLLVPELHTVPLSDPSVQVQQVIEQPIAFMINDAIAMSSPIDAPFPTTATQDRLAGTPRSSRSSRRHVKPPHTHATDVITTTMAPMSTVPTDELIVFHDSDVALTPRVMPPMQAELPPGPAREPRTQLRGPRPVQWQQR